MISEARKLAPAVKKTHGPGLKIENHAFTRLLSTIPRLSKLTIIERRGTWPLVMALFAPAPRTAGWCVSGCRWSQPASRRAGWIWSRPGNGPARQVVNAGMIQRLSAGRSMPPPIKPPLSQPLVGRIQPSFLSG